jgi:hypothetical protein
VADAFATADSDGQVPVCGLRTMPPNVAAVCRWTWVCARPPRGPNKHPDEAGYTVIRGTSACSLEDWLAPSGDGGRPRTGRQR